MRMKGKPGAYIEVGGLEGIVEVLPPFASLLLLEENKQDYFIWPPAAISSTKRLVPFPASGGSGWHLPPPV